MTIVLHETLQLYPDSVSMRIRGDSMEPTLLDGDAILVDLSQTEPATGDVVAVHFRGSGRCVGRFIQRDANAVGWRGHWLGKDNANYRRIPMPPGDAVVLGTVVRILERPSLPYVLEMPVPGQQLRNERVRVTSRDEIRSRSVFALRRLSAIAKELR